jgi:DnaJ family protein B protein 6
MATHLYETLNISNNATMDEIRKAYKKKALQTHPDRLPPGSTPEDKKHAEEQFRLVNNAYEILTDPQKRKTYDVHGTFPPPEPEFDRSSSDYDFRRRRHHAHSFGDSSSTPLGFSSFAFTDPFALFDEIFGEEFPGWREHRSRFCGPSPFMGMDPFFNPFSNPFARSPMGVDGLLAQMERDLFGMSSTFPSRTMLSSHAFAGIDSPFRDRGAGRFTQESYMTQTINGVTQTIHRRIDSDGNEHVTRTYPDGRKLYTINGIDQSADGYLPASETKATRHGSGRLLPARRPSSSSHAPQSRSDLTPPYAANSYNFPPQFSRGRDHLRRSEPYLPDIGYDALPDADSRMYDVDNDRHHHHRRRGPW